MAERRYYKIGEEVFVVPEKQLGEIKKVIINSKEQVFKAIVKLDSGKEGEYNLWDIDKHVKNKLADKPFDKAFRTAKARMSSESNLIENLNAINEISKKTKTIEDQDVLAEKLGDILNEVMEAFVMIDKKPNDYFEKSSVNKMVKKETEK